MFILDPCRMVAGKMMDEFTTKDKQAGSHEYNTVQQQGYSAHIKVCEAIVKDNHNKIRHKKRPQ